MKLATSALAAVLLALALAACGGGGGTDDSGADPAAEDPAALEASAWILSDGIDVEGWERAAPSIGFDRGRVSGSNGCNSFGGSYETDGSSLSFGELAATMKGCPPPAAEVERAFMGQLEATSEWRIEDGELVLGGGDGELRFRAASPAGSWRATSLLQGEAVTGPIAGSEITAEIGDGAISGSSGCNQYSGDFRTEGSSVAIGPVGGTEMGCTTPAGVMEQEQAYLEALPLAAEFRLEGGNLVLLTAQGTIVATFEPIN